MTREFILKAALILTLGTAGITTAVLLYLGGLGMLTPLLTIPWFVLLNKVR